MIDGFKSPNMSFITSKLTSRYHHFPSQNLLFSTFIIFLNHRNLEMQIAKPCCCCMHQNSISSRKSLLKFMTESNNNSEKESKTYNTPNEKKSQFIKSFSITGTSV